MGDEKAGLVSDLDGTVRAEIDRSYAARTFVVALAISVLDGVSLGIILPLLPFLILHFGASTVLVTQLVAFFGLASFLANPLLGRLSDRFGRITVVQASLLGTLLSYLGILFSWSLVGIFMFRVLGGVFAGRTSVIRALVTDGLSTDRQAAQLSWVTAVGPIGAALGPVIAGVIGLMLVDPLSQYHVILWVATGSTVASILAVWANSRLQRGPQVLTRSAVETGQRVSPVLVFKRVWLALVLTALIAYGVGVLFSVTALLVRARFGWGVGQTSWLFGALAAILALARIVLFKPMLKTFGQRGSLLLCLAISAPALAMVGLFRQVTPFLIAFVICSSAMGLCNLAITLMVSVQAESRQRGYTLGMAQSFAAIAGFVSASTNGFWFHYVGPGAPHMVAAVVLMVAFAMSAIWAPRSMPLRAS